MNESHVVDSKIVELSLQNEQFESNASKTLSTLEKLKQHLTFGDAGKSIDLARLNMNALTTGVNALSGGCKAAGQAIDFMTMGQIAKFTLVQDAVRGIESRITGVINQAKNMVASLSIDQVSAGWGKYAQKTESVATIMSATAKNWTKEQQENGEQMAAVNAQLAKLNWFTDETSYNFTDMTNNIGKFTSNNVKLEEAVTAMQGISTWAAKSGAKVGEASRAMYNLSQAIGVGSVKLIDWRSIENANMGTAEFKETVIQTAEAMGMLTKAGDDTWKTLQGHEVSVQNFSENLKDEWFSSEVLIKSLEKYGGFTDKLYEFMDTVSGDVSTSTVLGYIDEFAKSGSIDNLEAKAQELGISSEELKLALTSLSSEELEFGRKAFVAAQEAKTFGDAIDATKDAVSTAWMNTFETLFGDYQKAKRLWTDLANSLWEVFAGPVSGFNDKLSEAFETTGAATLEDWQKFEESGLASESFKTAVLAMAKEHGDITDEMTYDLESFDKAIKDGVISTNALTEAWALMTGQTSSDSQQSAENIEKIKEAALDVIRGNYGNNMEERFAKLTENGYDPQQVQDYVNALHKAAGGTWNLTDEVFETVNAQFSTALTAVEDLTNEQLAEIGVTREQVDEFKKASEEAKNLGKIMVDGQGNLSFEKMSGAELWTKSLYNAGNTLLSLLGALGEAWGSVVPETTVSGIRAFLEDLYLYTSRAKDFVEQSEGLRTVLRGVASVLAIVSSFLVNARIAIFESIKKSGALTFLGKALSFLSDISIATQSFLTHFNVFGRLADFVSSAFGSATKTVAGFFKSIAESTGLSMRVHHITNAFKAAFGKDFLPYMDGVDKRWKDFTGRTKDLFKGGFSFGKIKIAFGDFRKNVLEYFLQYPGFKAFSDAFRLNIANIKRHLKSFGIDVNGIKKQIGSFVDSSKLRFSAVTDAVRGFIKGIPAIGPLFVGLKSAAETTFKNFIPYFSKIGDKFGEFRERLKALGGINFGNIRQAFVGFKETVLDYISKFSGFTKFKKAFSDAGASIKKTFTDLTGTDFDSVKEKLIGFFQPVRNVASVVASNVKASLPNVQKAFTGFGNHLKGTGGKIKEFFESVKNAGGVKLTNIRDTFDSFRKTVVDYFTNFEGFRAVRDAFSGLWSDVKEQLRASGFPIEDIIERFNGMKEALSTTFDSVRSKVRDFFTPLTQVFAAFPKNGKKFQRAFQTTFKGLGKHIQGLPNRFAEFREKVKQLGGINFKNLSDVFKAFVDTVWDYWSNFKGFKEIKDAFGSLWNDIRSKLRELGFPIDTLAGLFSCLGKTIGGVFSSLPGWVSKGVSTLSKWYDKIAKSEIVQNAIANFSSAFSVFFSGIGDHLAGLPEKFSDFIRKVKEMGGLKLNNLGNVFKEFYNTVIRYFTNFDGFRALKEAASSLVSDVKSKLGEFGIDIDGIKGKILGFVTPIKEAFESIKWPTDLNKIPEFIESLFDTISGLFGDFNFAESIKNMFGMEGEATEIDGQLDETSGFLERFKNTVTTIVSNVSSIAKVLVKAAPTIISGFVAFKAVTGILRLIESVNKYIKSITRDRNATAFLKVAIGFIAIAYAIKSLVGTIQTLGAMDNSSLDQGVGALLKIVGMLALLTYAISKTDKSASGKIFGLTAIIAAIGASLFVLSLVKRNKLEHVKDIITSMLGWAMALSLVTKSGKDSLSGGEQLYAIAALIASIGAVLGLLTFVDQDKLEHVAEMINGVIGWCMAITAEIGLLKPSIEAFGGLIGLIAAVGIVMIALSLLPLNEDLVTKVGLFTQILDGLGLATIALTASGKLGGAGSMLSGLAALGALVGVVTLVATILSGLYALLDTLGGDDDKAIHAAKEFLERGFGMLEWLMERIGRVFGAIVGGFVAATAEKATSALPIIADFLSTFAEKLGDVSFDNVDFSGIKKIVSAVSRISWAGFKIAIEDFIANALTGEDAVANFATAAGQTIGIIKSWNDNTKDLEKVHEIDVDSFDTLVQQVKDVSKAGLGIAISDFVISLFPNDKEKRGSIDKFADATTKLSGIITDWNSAMDGISAITVPTGLDTLIASIKEISLDSLLESMLAVIIFDGDVSQYDPLGDFKKNVEKLSGALTYWKGTIESLGDFAPDNEVVNQAITKLQESFDLIKKGPFGALGDVLAGIFGEDLVSQIQDFSINATRLGGGLKNFVDALGDNFNISTFQDVSTASLLLGNGLTSIANSAVTIHNLPEYVEGLPGLMRNLGAAFGQLTLDSAYDPEEFKSISESAKALGDGVKTLSEISVDGDISDGDIVDAYAANIEKIRDKVASLSGLDTTGVEKLKTAVSDINASNLSSLDNAGEGASDEVSEGLAKGASSITSAMSDLLQAAGRAISDNYDSFQVKGRIVMNKFGLGLSDKQDYVTSKVASIVTAAAAIVDGHRKDFSEAGRFAVLGFAGGIALHTYVAVKSASEMARASLEAVKRVLNSHSPSKETEKLGSYFGQGFVLAIDGYQSTAYQSGAGVAEAARSGLQKGVAAIKNVLGSDVGGDPVIRPVLDLSEIQNGAGMIGDILRFDEPIGVMGSLNAISTNSRYNPNSDILSALSSLQKTLGSQAGGNTYVIDGVTYDDGTNISSAVRTLVHAATVNRRMN